MDFKAYIQKRISSGSLTSSAFGSLSGNALQERLKNISLFSSANLEQLKNIDMEKLLSGEIKEGAKPEEQALGDIINVLMETEGIQDVADLDKDGEISAEEAQKFLQSLMGNDGDSESFSFDDIDKAIEKMGLNLEKIAEDAVSEVLKQEKAEEAKKAEEVKKAEEAQKAAEAQQAQQAQQARQAQQNAPVSSAGGGGTGVSAAGTPAGSAANTAANASTKNANAPKSAEEIQSLISEKEGKIETINQEADAAIQEQEQAKTEAMKEKGISEEQQKQYQEKNDALNEKISEAEKKVQDKEKDISDWESSIASNENYISNIDSQIQANKSKLGSISEDDENASSKKAEINSKIDALEKEKEKIEKENKDLKEKVETAQGEVNELKNTTIPGYEKEKSDLLNKLAENSGAAKGGKDAVNSVAGDLQKFETEISSIKQKRDADISALRAEIQDLQTQLKDVQSKDDRNSFIRENSAESPLFDPNMEINTQYITDGNMPYMLIGPKDADPNEELPVLVYLHGLGEVGKGEQGLYSQHGPGGIVTNWDMQNFNGYIICPQLSAGNWNNANAEANLRALMDNFNANHNTGKSVIMGASLGGSGATYMANHMGSEYFDEAVILSGYSGGVNDIQIPVTGYVGTQDDPTSINIMKNQFGNNLNYLNATHGTLPKTLFTIDEDGDGCSDFLQRLFARK